MQILQILGEAIKCYEMQDINAFIDVLQAAEYPTQKAKKIEYLNIPAAFDIETTSTYIDGQKVAFMYIWQLNINGLIIYGRTWNEFIYTLEEVSSALYLCHERQLVIYVHNLAYEFQFMRKYLLWQEVFSIDERRPVMAECSLGIRFKCSFILTNLSLDGVSRNLQKNPVKKLVGDLDYNLIRTSETPLTAQELAYCVNDVRVVVALIREKIETDGGITKIPLTNTGYVRNYTRKHCLYSYDKSAKYNRAQSSGRMYYNLIHTLNLSGPAEYAMLKRAFQGGFTHASILNVDKIHRNVDSFDITSSYPTVMLADYFPMSTGFRVYPATEEQFKGLLSRYCCLFDIRFYNLQQRDITSESYLSESKCRAKGATLNNGRIAYADEVTTTLTEIDLDIVNKCYTYDSFAIGKVICYRRGYLPKPFIECMLHFYEGKTTLKGVQDKQAEYMNLKGMLNSLYGMTVTDICRPEYAYIDEWDTIPANVDDVIEKYNKSSNRFMFYPWGIWVTAHARYNLFELINECKEDYIYSDTDSVKMLNSERHEDFINDYNARIQAKVNKCLDLYKIPRERANPCDIHGVRHPLGVWDKETAAGAYTEFKTLGAKRYMYKDSAGKYHMTVAGLSKQTALKYLYHRHNYSVILHLLTNKRIYGILDMFTNKLYIPAGYTGKQTHTYIDSPADGYIKDYRGHIAHFEALTSVHLEGAEYSLSITDNYIKYIKGFRELIYRQYD